MEEEKIIIGYCFYCKSAIYEEDDFYVEDGLMYYELDDEIDEIYHKECWELLKEDEENDNN